MNQKSDFKTTISEGYSSKGESIILGGAILNGEAIADAFVKIPLKTLNRHGLIAGATGTGKTKTIQVLSEQLSSKGIPVLMMDIKGDFSGIAMPGEEKSFITERHQKINIPFSPSSYPVELLSLSDQSGVRLRATISEFCLPDNVFHFSSLLQIQPASGNSAIFFMPGKSLTTGGRTTTSPDLIHR